MNVGALAPYKLVIVKYSIMQMVMSFDSAAKSIGDIKIYATNTKTKRMQRRSFHCNVDKFYCSRNDKQLVVKN